MFAKDVVGCFCDGSVKAVDQDVSCSVLIFKGEEWSKLSYYRCLKNFCDVTVLEFLQTEPDILRFLSFFFFFLLFHNKKQPRSEFSVNGLRHEERRK